MKSSFLIIFLLNVKVGLSSADIKISCNSHALKVCEVTGLTYKEQKRDKILFKTNDIDAIHIECGEKRRNDISLVPGGMFHEFHGKKIDFKIQKCYNFLSINKNSFTVGCLKNIKIVHTSLETIETQSFAVLDNLEHLVLSNNKLTNLKDGTFEGLSSLISLDLSNNRIESLQAKLFTLSSAKFIDLSNNNINHIDSKAFKKSKSLRSIDLTSNECINATVNFQNSKSLLEACDITKTTTETPSSTTSTVNPEPSHLVGDLLNNWYIFLVVYLLVDVFLAVCIVLRRRKSVQEAQLGDEIYEDIEFYPTY